MGSLEALAVAIAPEIARWISSDPAGTTMAAIGKAVESAAGTAEPEAAAAALRNDPEAASRLRVALAQIAAELDKADRSAAMDGIASLVRAGPAASAGAAPTTQRMVRAWAAPVISIVVLLVFGAMMALIMVRGMPAGSETAGNLMLGTVSAMATSVVAYWVGSSAGSAQKDDRLADLLNKRG